MKPLSAVDSIRPAVDRTEKYLFEPFRWAKWWRLAVLGLATGEFASSGGCNFRGLGNLNKAGAGAPSGLPQIPGLSHGQIAALIALLVTSALVLAIVHLYVASVSRFMLFDTVATGRYHLREGWARWHGHGVRYFLFNLAFAATAIALYSVLIGIPLLLAWRSGIVHHFKEHWGIFLLGLLVLLPIFILSMLVIGIIGLFVKDFAIAIIALENVSVPNALRKLWKMVKSAKSDFAFYILMKIAMAIVVGIALAIADVIVVLILFVPVAIVGAIVVAASPSAFHNPVMIALAVTIAVAVILPVALFVIGLIAAPAVMFYESYALSFFASRYEPLWKFMNPEPPAGLTPSQPSQPPFSEPPPENPPLDLPPDPSPA